MTGAAEKDGLDGVYADVEDVEDVDDVVERILPNTFPIRPIAIPIAEDETELDLLPDQIGG